MWIPDSVCGGSFVPAHKPPGCRRADTDRRGGPPGAVAAEGVLVPIDELESLTVAWTPPPDAFAASPAGRLAARHGISDARSLAERAAADPAWYWAAGMEDLGIPWMRPYDTVVDLSRGIEHPRFFVGGLLNWADFAVDRWVREGAARRAVWWEGDDGATLTLTYAELKTASTRPPAPCRRRASAPATSSRCCSRWSPRRSRPSSPRRRSAPSSCPCSAVRRAGRPRPPGGLGATLLVTCDAFPGAVGRSARRWPTRRSATCRPERRAGGPPPGADVPMTPGRDSWWTRSAPRPTGGAGRTHAGRRAVPAALHVREPAGRRAACTPTRACRSRSPWRCGTAWAWTRLRDALADRHGLGHGVVRDRRRAHQRRHRGLLRGRARLAEPDRLWAVAERSGRRCWASPPPSCGR